MQDNELYEGILDLEPPWRVVNVILDTGGREVRVEIENQQKRLPCPGALSTPISPPMAPTRRRLIARPRPVPPCRRAFRGSAW